MKKFFWAVLGVLWVTSAALAETVEVKVKNPSDRRLWLADVKAP